MVVGLRSSVHVKGEVKRSPFGSVQELQGTPVRARF